jgi:gluconate:H+ symporter, GntP family
MLSPLYVSILLIGSISAIILLSAKFKFNTFFVLLIIAAIVGLLAGFGGVEVINLLKKGFGNTLEKIGLLIILGTTLGVLLEKSNATLSLANYILSKTGEANAPLAVTLMGFMIGLPIFCDSGFVVLIGLVMSLVHKLPKWHILLVICLASALFSVHCLVPPHPGITAAAGILKVDIGRAMLLGVILAIPPTIVAYIWARYINKKMNLTFDIQNIVRRDSYGDNQYITQKNLPSPVLSFLPIVVPILLIALKSFVSIKPTLSNPIILFIGEPVVALFIGILLSLFLVKNINNTVLNPLLDNAIEKSGSILAVTAAGGAFGEVINALKLGDVFGASFAGSSMGLFIPFALAAIFKTAQGSSTVAVISTAGILQSLLPSLGLDNEGGALLALMACGAGSMVVSHTNDSYFWVISKFSKLEAATTLRAHTTVSFLMGIVAFLGVLIAALFV